MARKFKVKWQKYIKKTVNFAKMAKMLKIDEKKTKNGKNR